MFKYLLVAVILAVASIQPLTTHACPQEFPVNVIVLAPDSERTIDTPRAERFISILNSRFRERSGEKIFDFTLKAFQRLDEITPSGCADLVELGDQHAKPSKDEVTAAFGACQDSRIADREAINVFIFRSHWDGREERKSSRIYFNDFEPFIFMNIDRLDNDWSVWEHEFGHVFGLPPYPTCGATTETPTNIMSKELDICDGTGGNRELGFEWWQTTIIRAAGCAVASNNRE